MFEETIKCGIASGILWGVAKLTLKPKNVKSELTSGMASMTDIAYMVIGAPIAEELIFRKFLQGYLFKNISFRKRNALTSLLFTAAHWRNSDLNMSYIDLGVKYISLYTLSTIFGSQYEHKKSISTPIFSHGINNYMSMLSLSHPMSIIFRAAHTIHFFSNLDTKNVFYLEETILDTVFSYIKRLFPSFNKK